MDRISVFLTGTCKRITVPLLAWLQGTKYYRLMIRRLFRNKVLYRIAETDDAPGLSELYGYRKFPELGDPVEALAGDIGSLTGRGCILVAELMGRIAGAVVVTDCPWDLPLDQDWWLLGLLVRSHYRGAGIGEGLVLKALEKPYEGERKRMSLLVSNHNAAAIHLYLKMGFTPSPITYKDIERATGFINQDFILLSKTMHPLKDSPPSKK